MTDDLADRIAVANRMWARMPGWVRTDAALRRLKERLPGFAPEDTLLKSVAVNALYGTYVLAIVRMADHVASVIAAADLATAGPDLVERIAALKPSTPQETARRHISFASKFAHFFVNGDRFPIYDDRARAMLRFHLGASIVKMPAKPYVAFAENFAEFRRRSRWAGSTWEIDRYLWLAGSIRALKNPKVQVNREIRDLAASGDGRIRADIEVLLGGEHDRSR